MSTSRKQVATTVGRKNLFVIGSALLALFLGALDSLIMSAAMPTIVTELGGLALYAWVYSAYFLARAVSLPVFGKLSDVYGTKNLFLFSIILFLVSSAAAGSAQSMGFLIFCRVFQGIGAGGNFAFVYIILSEVAPPGKRAKTLSLASTVWGISSVIGPTLGGFIVTYFSWRWIFYINIPLGMLSVVGISVFLEQGKKRSAQKLRLDIAGLLLFSCFVLGLLTAFIVGGRGIAWYSLPMLVLVSVTLLFGLLFYRTERRAEEPMIDIDFFRIRNFSLGNGAIFFASFTIFSFFAYVPLYIQGSLNLFPLQVGLAMVSLSLGWSCGAFFYGRVSTPGSEKKWSVAGGIILFLGSFATLGFELETTMLACFLLFLVVGIGMGFLSLSTFITVQNSVDEKDLGIVSSFHQFCRSLGGTIGVGICGGLVTTGLFRQLDQTLTRLPADLMMQLRESTENLLRPEFVAKVPAEALETLQQAVLSGVFLAFLISTLASFCALLCCIFLDGRK